MPLLPRLTSLWSNLFRKARTERVAIICCDRAMPLGCKW